MARTAIVVTTPDRSGVTQPSTQASDFTNGMYIANNTGRIILEVKNNNAGSQTIAIPFGPNGTVDGVAPADRTVTLAAGATKIIGPFPPSFYNQTDRSVYVNPSVNTDLAIRAYAIV